MLRILEIAFAVFSGGFGIYFGILGAASIFKYVFKYYDWDAEEKVYGAKIRAKYFSLSAIGCLVALAVGLVNLASLVLLPFFVGVLWLDFVIYRSVILRSERRSR